MSGDLVAFLRARLDERASKARAACDGGEGRWTQGDTLYHQEGRVEDERGRTVVFDEGAPSEAQAVHIADNDPEWVLAEVAAKRRTVDEHRAIMGPGWCSTCDIPGDVKGNVHGCQTLRLLAAPYAGHADYRPEWAPNA